MQEKKDTKEQEDANEQLECNPPRKDTKLFIIDQQVENGLEANNHVEEKVVRTKKVSFASLEIPLVVPQKHKIK